MRKKPFKPSSKLRKKPCMLISEKSPQLDQKTRKKTKDSINKKPSKLDEERRKKTNHLLLCRR